MRVLESYAKPSKIRPIILQIFPDRRSRADRLDSACLCCLMARLVYAQSAPYCFLYNLFARDRISWSITGVFPSPGKTPANIVIRLCSSRTPSKKDVQVCFRLHSPKALNPGWSSGRRPRGQKNLRSDSVIGRSLMLAKRSIMKPCALNSQFSLP